MTTRPRIRTATPADALALAEFGAATFRATYATDAPTDELDHFIAQGFGLEVQSAELVDPACRFLIAEVEDDLVGYGLMREGRAPPCVPGERPLQLDRLYVAPSVQGRGVGTALLEAAVATARKRNHDLIWLSVWEHNRRAIAVYHRWGFVDVGEVGFDLAGERQVDRVLVYRLPPSSPQFAS